MKAEVESLIQQINLVSRFLGSVNLGLQFGELRKFNLAGPAPEGVYPEAWKALQERIQALNVQIQSFVRHQGNQVVIGRKSGF